MMKLARGRRSLIAGGAALLALAGLALTAAPASAAQHAPATPSHFKVHKINVLGEWAHPDDDTSIIGPCGVWHQLYHIRCGVIQLTRGEGGGNAVGPETGPPLGIRRENEDRAAHFRSGTTDLFYLDRVDFYYNQSAPLTQFFWGHDETLSRVTRIIRETQPDIYIGFAPTLAVGHGNHQQAGRFIWEGVQAAADPNMFPDQLTGPDALTSWQVKKVFSGFSNFGSGVAGTGGQNAPNCLTGFRPAANNPNTVSGVWTGYPSPYHWPAGNLQNQSAGSAKTWAQVAAEGTSAYATQSRTMYKQVASPGCTTFGMNESFVPFQPNVNPDGTLNPNAGLDKAIFFGATMQDPGGMPTGSLFYLTFSRFFNVAGDSFQVTVHAKSGSGTLPQGSVKLNVPSGWTVSGPQSIGPISTGSESTATFTVAPSANVSASQYKLSAQLTDGAMTGYTDNVMQIVPGVEGRFQRWGKFAEYDQWVTQTAPQALRLGRSSAVDPIGTGETISVPVDVHNWSNAAQSGNVSLSLPSGFSADTTSKSYSGLAPGADTTVTFQVTNTDTTLASSTSYPVGITTSYGSPASSSSETLSLDLVPATVIPQASQAPTLDGQESQGEYPGPALDLSKVWQGAACNPAGVDCGTAPGAQPGDPNSTFAKVAWSGDALYFFVHIRDQIQSYAATPQQCVAHWLVDSVEIGIDPRGNSSDLGPLGAGLPSVADTATTFKTGIFPYTNDPTNTLGNPSPNGPCWERDADNHQGYSNGPLAQTVTDPPNAPGMQVASTAQWVGNNDPNQPHNFPDGYYNLEVKIPFADLPSAVGPTSTPPTGSASGNAVDPEHMGLDIIPYIERNQLHIDQSTREAWSAWNSVQSDPYHWGHAYLQDYTPPAGQSDTPTTPIIPASAAQGADSPQTIYQSARNGVPIAGLAPAPAGDQLSITSSSLQPSSANLSLTATGSGRAHIFLWSGDHSYIPVWTSSCGSDPFEVGFTPCSASDGTAAPWGTNMGGHLIADKVVQVSAGSQNVSIPLDSDAYNALKSGGSALVSFETSANQMQAFALPLNCGSVITGTHSGSLAVSSGTTCLAGGSVTGPVTVASGASFAAVGGSVGGGLTTNGGAAVSVDGTSLAGPVTLTGVTGQVSLTNAQVAGPVRLTGNNTDPTPIVLGDNTISGLLACTGNAPPPVNDAQPNAVSGPETGQCTGL
jgi:LmbE family N-acetylglucosaminyl deacetylase